MRFCIEVAALNYGEGAIASLGEAWHDDIFRELVFENFAESAAITGEKKAKRAAEDDAVRLDAGNLRGEAESNAFSDFVPGSLIFDV